MTGNPPSNPNTGRGSKNLRLVKWICLLSGTIALFANITSIADFLLNLCDRNDGQISFCKHLTDLTDINKPADEKTDREKPANEEICPPFLGVGEECSN